MAYKLVIKIITGAHAEVYRFNLREVMKAKRNIWDGLDFISISWGTYYLLENDLKVSEFTARKIMNAYTKLNGAE